MRNGLLMSSTLVALAACTGDAPPAHTTTVAVPATPAVTPLPSTRREAGPAVAPAAATASAGAPAPAFVTFRGK